MPTTTNSDGIPAPHLNAELRRWHYYDSDGRYRGTLLAIPAEAAESNRRNPGSHVLHEDQSPTSTGKGVTTQVSLPTPAAHPAWLRAVEGPMDSQRAIDLAAGVCQVTAERDWLLVRVDGSSAALLDVLVPAVDAMYAHWIEDLDTERQGSGAATTERRESFAALSAVTAYAALTCSMFSVAKVMAFRSRTTGQAERSVALAELVMDGAIVRCPWRPMASPGRAAVAAVVTAHRATSVA